MRRRFAFGVLLLAAFGLTVTTSAGKPAAPKDIPVTVVFMDATGFAIQSDGGGDYVNGVSGVTAVIVPLGNLQLKTGTQRAFWLDFGVCVSQGSCSPPSFGAGYTQGYMTTSCPTSLLTMSGWQFCNLNVHFTADGLGWFIRFGQGQGYDTTPATVTRVDASNWTIAVPESGIALLQSYPLKGKVTYTDHGYFYMPVSMTVTLE